MNFNITINTFEIPFRKSPLSRLSHLLARYNLLFGVTSVFIILTSFLLGLFIFEPPQLNNPFSDFVTIGTSWSAELQQFNAFLQQTTNSPALSIYQGQRWHKTNHTNRVNSNKSEFPISKFKRDAKLNHYSSRHSHGTVSHIESQFCLNLNDNTPGNLWETYSTYGRLIISMNRNPVQHASTNSTFFDHPDAFSSLCSLQSRIFNLSSYQNICYKRPKLSISKNLISHEECCSTWSLPTMIAAVFGKSSCDQLSEVEVWRSKYLIETCFPSFLNGYLTRACWDKYGTDPHLICPLVQPADCLISPLLPLIMATLLPDNVTSGFSNWHTTLIVLPLRQSDSELFFTQFDREYRTGELSKNLSVPLHFQGIHLNVFDEIVTQLMHSDTTLIYLSILSLLILLLIWTGALIIPIFTILSVIWSLMISYLVYTKLLGVPNFPIINLMAVVLTIGLSSDDILVFHQIWKHGKKHIKQENSTNVQIIEITDLLTDPSIPDASRSTDDSQTRLILNDKAQADSSGPPNRTTKTDDPNLLARQIHYTLFHTFVSITLTTISTVIGLALNLYSSIVAVQRFAIFSCLVIVCNYFFFILIIPFWIFMLQINWSTRFTTTLKRFNPSVKLIRLARGIQISHFFAKIIIKSRILYPVLYILLCIYSSYYLIWLRRFDTIENANHGIGATFLRSSHPLELFVQKQSNKFWAERNIHHYNNLLQVNFVWGALPENYWSVFNYDHSDLMHSVKLNVDVNLNISSIEARKWIRQFCNELKKMPYLFQSIPFNYYQNTLNSFKLSNLNPLLSRPVWCPLGRYMNSMENYLYTHTCNTNGTDFCCSNGSPIDLYNSPDYLFMQCLYEYLSSNELAFMLDEKSGYRFLHTMVGNFTKPVGFMTSVLTNISLMTATPFEVKNNLDTISKWFQNLLSTAPQSMANGFMFSPDLDNYKVALNVTDYVYWTIVFAVLVASFLIFISSFDLLLAVLALLLLIGCLLTTINVLTLFDHWKLGVVEGLVISLAAGLAIDPCIHLAMAFSLSGNKINKSNKCLCCPTQFYGLDTTQNILTNLGPAITISSWTTALAGLPMIFSNLLCFHQVGAFLLCLMLCSWCFCYIFFSGIYACLSIFNSKGN